MATLRKFARRLFIILNGIAVVLFLLACANAFLKPVKWWPISLLGLIFPLLLLVVSGFFLFWLFVPTRRPWALLSFITLIIGWSNIHALLAFHPGARFSDTKKSPRSFRILTWNVRSWDEFITRKPGASGHRSKMMEFIDGKQADVLCFQEFYESRNPKEMEDNISYIREQLHFPYYFFSRDYRREDGMYEAGVVIFSRYPIIDSLTMNYGRPDGVKATESLIGANINVGGDTIRIYTTHLQSVLFRGKDFHDLQIIRNVNDSILTASMSIAKKLRYAFRIRAEQAQKVREQLDSCPYPAVICGDFNDVPNSYTYFTIRGSRRDAFIEKGFGIGRTYAYISPTLRIDYILADPRIDVLQCARFSLPYSDHHPVVADLQMHSQTP